MDGVEGHHPTLQSSLIPSAMQTPSNHSGGHYWNCTFSRDNNEQGCAPSQNLLLDRHVIDSDILKFYLLSGISDNIFQGNFEGLSSIVAAYIVLKESFSNLALHNCNTFRFTISTQLKQMKQNSNIVFFPLHILLPCQNFMPLPTIQVGCGQSAICFYYSRSG